jgi:energy-coupling factor transporter ATP-binding protein EcfA2
MDEPTAALGPQETAQVGELVRTLKADGIGIFLISHDIYDVFDLADRICVMKNGRVVGTARRRNHQGRSPRHDHPRRGGDCRLKFADSLCALHCVAPRFSALAIYSAALLGFAAAAACRAVRPDLSGFSGSDSDIV